MGKKILLVDDHEVVRVGLASIINDHPDFTVVACAQNKAEAINAVEKHSPDIAIVDIRLQGESGIDICREITSHYPSTKVIMLTSFGDDDLIVKSIVAGASGYLLKQINNNEILSGISQVAAGGCLFDATTTASVMKIMRNSVEEKRGGFLKERLSKTEFKILALIGKGKTNQEIGEVLNLSTSTIKNYVGNLLVKLEVNNRAEAAVYAARNSIET